MEDMKMLKNIEIAQPLEPTKLKNLVRTFIDRILHRVTSKLCTLVTSE